jgi:hypothetical protein
VGHVGHRQHGLVAGAGVAVDADVAAVAGPVGVVVVAALLDHRVGQVGDHAPGPPPLELGRIGGVAGTDVGQAGGGAGAQAGGGSGAGRVGRRVPQVVPRRLERAPAQRPGVQPAELPTRHRAQRAVLHQPRLELAGLAAAQVELVARHRAGADADQRPQLAGDLAEGLAHGAALSRQGRGHVVQPAPHRHPLEPGLGGVARRGPRLPAGEVDAVGHPLDDVDRLDPLADRQQHRVARQPDQQPVDAGVDRQLVGQRRVVLGERGDAPHRPDPAVGRPHQVPDDGVRRRLHRPSSSST